MLETRLYGGKLSLQILAAFLSDDEFSFTLCVSVCNSLSLLLQFLLQLSDLVS